MKYFESFCHVQGRRKECVVEIEENNFELEVEMYNFGRMILMSNFEWNFKFDYEMHSINLLAYWENLYPPLF
jgi:hypothetical protein